MRSTLPQDATTRSRIRDAAVELFGRNGYTRTSVRTIAERAEVSPALIIHHFGSKEGLRQACDQHIVAELFGRNTELSQAGSTDAMAATMQRWLADVDAHRVPLDYLTRMLTEESELGDQLFDLLVDRTEQLISDEVAAGRMRAGSDPRMTAVLVASQGLVPLLLERHIGRAIGSHGLGENAIRRMTIPTLELYTYGLYSDETVLGAARAALKTTADNGSAE